MPIDFKIVLSTHVVELPEAFEEAELLLMPRGCWRTSEVIVSGEDDEGEKTLIIDSIRRDLDHLAAWTSIYMEFCCPTFAGLGMQLDRVSVGSSKCLLSLDRRTMLALHRDRIPADLYDAFGTLANVAGAEVGVGGFSLDLAGTIPEQILANVRNDPNDTNLWDDLFVVRASALTEVEEMAWADAFERLETQGYTFFISHGLLELSREFG